MRSWVLVAVFVAVGIGYAVYFREILTRDGLFEYIGLDYRAFRSTAEIARARGFAQIYDLATQAEYQRPLYDSYSFGFRRNRFAPVPTPYLPVFVVPFLILPYCAPIPGFVLWTLLSIAVLTFSLQRVFVTSGTKRCSGAPLVLLLSLPVFFNLLFGQVNALLLLFLTEFLIAERGGREVQSGFWLGGLLLKPQTLIIFLPGLLISRRFKIVAGYVISTLVILGISVALAGVHGMVQLVQLLRLYPGNLPTTFAGSMMNWRALTINHALVLSPEVSWRLAMAGLSMSLVLGLALWLPQPQGAVQRLAPVVLGTWAATAGVAWHSHIHMAVPMLAPLLYLTLTGELPGWLLHLWVLAPSIVFLEETYRIGASDAHREVGLVMLAVNSVVLVWTLNVAWNRPGAHHASCAPLPPMR